MTANTQSQKCKGPNGKLYKKNPKKQHYHNHDHVIVIQFTWIYISLCNWYLSSLKSESQIHAWSDNYLYYINRCKSCLPYTFDIIKHFFFSLVFLIVIIDNNFHTKISVIVHDKIAIFVKILNTRYIVFNQFLICSSKLSGLTVLYQY